MKSLSLALVLLVAAVFSQRTHAQTTTIVDERPLHTRHFSGTVVDRSGSTVAYATVELLSPRDHHVLASTFADGKGFFSFDDKKYGKTVELRVSQKGFNISDYTATIKPFADVHLRLVISVAN